MNTNGKILAGATNIGHYTLLREIGRGSFSFVYEAKDARSGDHIALKVFSSMDAGCGFVREVGAGVRFKHPNLLPALDVGYAPGGKSYVAYEFARGGSLRERMTNSPAEISFVRHVIIEIARGLTEIHAAALVHRDLKPENALFDNSDFYSRLRVADLGTAESVRNSPARGDSGSPAYMSPEQIRGSCDIRSDVYALGVIAYELLRGKRPFTGSAGDVLRGHLDKEPDLSFFAPAVAVVLAKALHKTPNNRYDTAYQLARDLNSALADPSEDIKIILSEEQPTAASFSACDPISQWSAKRCGEEIRITGRDAPKGLIKLEAEGVMALSASSPIQFAGRDANFLTIGGGEKQIRQRLPLYGLPPLVAIRRYNGDLVTNLGGSNSSLTVFRWDGTTKHNAPLPSPLKALMIITGEDGEHLLGVDLQCRNLFFLPAGNLSRKPAAIPLGKKIKALEKKSGQVWIQLEDGEKHLFKRPK